MAGDEPAPDSKNTDKEPLLDKKEEFTLLLKGIEENSKHARSVMFALVLACVYVLLSAFSSPVDDSTVNLPTAETQQETQTNHRSIELPVIKVKVEDSQFFFFSPLVILIAFLYLHIYIRELSGRLDSLKPFIDNYKFSIDNPNHLLFPWIVVFAFQAKNKKMHRQTGRGKKEISAAEGLPTRPSDHDFLIRNIANILLWILAPLVLWVLWANFVFREDWVSILTCLYFILAFCIARYNAKGELRRLTRVVMLLIMLVLAVFTLSSVPVLSQTFGLSIFWSKANLIINRFIEYPTNRLFIPLALILSLQLAPFICVTILNRFAKSAYRVRLQIRALCFPEKSIIHYLFALSRYLFTIFRRHSFYGIPNKISDAALKGLWLGYLDFWNVDFSNANLTRTNIHHTKFYFSRFIKADISDSKFVSSEFYSVNMHGIIMDNATSENSDFSEANLTHASLKKIRFKSSSFNKADLSKANMSESQFISVHFYDTDFTCTNLKDASLLGETKLERVKLIKAHFENTEYSNETEFPPDFKIPDSLAPIDEND